MPSILMPCKLDLRLCPGRAGQLTLVVNLVVIFSPVNGPAFTKCSPPRVTPFPGEGITCSYPAAGNAGETQRGTLR
jgi:hypothetical protein